MNIDEQQLLLKFEDKVLRQLMNIHTCCGIGVQTFDPNLPYEILEGYISNKHRYLPVPYRCF